MAYTPAVYGGIYIADGVTATSALNTSTYTTIDAFNAATGANGAANGTTPDKDNNKITVGPAGKYRVWWAMAFTASANNTVLTMALFSGSGGTQTTEHVNVESRRKIGTGADVGSMSAVGVVTLAAGAELVLKGKVDTGTPTITPAFLNLLVEYIGA
jgi:hypothetical protein